MSWIRVDDNLGEHKKIMMLSSSLGVTETQAIGHMICLWLFVARNAWQDGDLTAWGIAGIESSAKWNGKKGVLHSSANAVGLLDGMVVHNWNQRAATYIKDKLTRKKSVMRPFKIRQKSVSRNVT